MTCPVAASEMAGKKNALQELEEIVLYAVARAASPADVRSMLHAWRQRWVVERYIESYLDVAIADLHLDPAKQRALEDEVAICALGSDMTFHDTVLLEDKGEQTIREAEPPFQAWVSLITMSALRVKPKEG